MFYAFFGRTNIVRISSNSVVEAQRRIKGLMTNVWTDAEGRLAAWLLAEAYARRGVGLGV